MALSGGSQVWHVARFTGGPISTKGAITGGSGYVDGSYTNVPLTGGLGSAATANITVSGGAVTVVTIVTAGPTPTATGATGYQVGDVLSASNTNLGGAGSGFSVPVTAITTWTYTPQSSFVYLTLVGGGAQGGGGHSTGGAGGGGGSGATLQDYMAQTTPASALTLRVAAVTNLLGGVAANGSNGDYTRVTGGTYPIPTAGAGLAGVAGGAINGGAGGNSGTSPGSANSINATGGTAGTPGAGGTGGSNIMSGPFLGGTAGGGGAGTSAGGGGIARTYSGTTSIAGGTLIGGGAGGCTPYGDGGAGGTTAGAGNSPAAGQYGAGGGGGGQNAVGAPGSGGLIIIREMW